MLTHTAYLLQGNEKVARGFPAMIKIYNIITTYFCWQALMKQGSQLECADYWW